MINRIVTDNRRTKTAGYQPFTFKKTKMFLREVFIVAAHPNAFECAVYHQYLFQQNQYEMEMLNEDTYTVVHCKNSEKAFDTWTEKHMMTERNGKHKNVIVTPNPARGQR